MNTATQPHGQLWVRRQARRLGFGRNPLRRRADRVEAGMALLTLVAALLMVAVGAMIGTSLRNSSDAAASRERAVLHEVMAHTLDSTEHQALPAPGEAAPLVRVGYVDQHGIARQGVTSVLGGMKTGTEVTVWLDQAGSIASTPHSAADSVAYGCTIAFLVVTGSWLLLWGAFRLALMVLNRYRSRAWDAEWLNVAPGWPRGQK